MIQAIIFDLDGVLVSSDTYHTDAWRATCLAWGLPFYEAEANRLRGVGRTDCARILMELAGVTLTQSQLEQFSTEKNDRYVASLHNITPASVFPGVPQLLKHLKARQLPLAVASSSKNARLILERTQLTDYFDAIIDGWDVTRSKPDPQIFQYAAQALHTVPQNCLVVEDAYSGVQAGLAMGAAVAGVGTAADAPGITYSLRTTGDLLYETF